MQTGLSFDEARRRVLDAAAAAPRRPPEYVPLADALRRTLAAPVVARDALPPFDTSAMDGFAVRAADFVGVTLPLVLPVLDTVAAGALPTRAVDAGTCVRIMTGAPLPAGADAIVPVEQSSVAARDARGRETVALARAPEPGHFVRHRGEAMEPGALALEAGRVVTPGIVGLLAALGVATVEVGSRPRVAVVATGDELVGVAESPAPGQIRDANGPALAAQVVLAGGVPLPPLVARDTEASIRAALDAAAEADVLVFAGGVSMGERDLVRDELERRGVTWAFWQVRQRPGKPLAFGTRPDGRLVFGLPGNPVSAAVCFEVYVRPLLAVLLSRTEPVPPLVPATLATSIPKAPGLFTFARVTARPGPDGPLMLTPTGPQGSHVARSLADADGLAFLPEPLARADAGLPVGFHPFGW